MTLLCDFVDTEFDHFLSPRGEFAPFPKRSDRPPWAALSESARAEVVAGAERLLDFPWPSLLAERYMDYARNGNRERYQRPSFERRDALGQLVAAECVEAEGRFMDQIVNGVWLILEESSWVVPAHNRQRWSSGSDVQPLPDVRKRYIDLFSAQTGALLAWTGYLLGDVLAEVSPLIPRRIAETLVERIIEPYMAHDDFWWMAFGEEHRERVNNWNPWCNSNCLTVSLLADPDDERRAEMVRKICRSLDRFIESYGVDGGCDEGPSYWGHAAASLFDCLELLFQASGGRVDLFGDERIANMGRYVYRMQLADSHYVNFADCVPKLSPPADLIYRYGSRIGDADMAAFGVGLIRNAAPRTGDLTVRAAVGPGGPRDLFRYLHAIFDFATLVSDMAGDAAAGDTGAAATASGVGRTAGSGADAGLLPAAVWLESVQVAVFRSHQGSEAGFAVAAKGGHNGESHNHNDVGQVIVFHDGEPILVDPGVETYTARTFSDSRYEIWTMQSAYHNLPTVAGRMQRPGSSAAAREASFSDDGESARFALEIAGAYPEDAGIESWRRTVALDRSGGRVTIEEAFALAGTSEIEWSFMCPAEPIVPPNPAGESIRLGSTVALTVSGAVLDARVDRIAIDDARLEPHWGSALYRLVLSGTSASGEVSFEIAAQ